MRPFFTFLICTFILTGCNFYEQDDYQEYYVVESYLTAGDDLPSVLLSTTAPIGEKYRFTDNTISKAEVELRRLAADSTIQKKYRYRLSDPGIFVPVRKVKVRDQQLYQLHIRMPDGHIIEAKTYVPKNFVTTNTDQLNKSYVYQSNKQIKVGTTPSSYITGRQTYYIFTVNAADPDSSNLTPFYQDLVEEQDSDIKNFFVNSSGIINEKNYDRKADNTISLTVPWIAIAFYGSNKLITNAIDDNLYDFLRTQEAQSGGATLSPGEIQNIRYNINGGIGIFGSLASDTNHVTITRPRP